jgi:sirohydrochlorin ferrochelatase
MNALIVIAHGSRLASSNAEIQAVTDRLRAHVSNKFRRVNCAFLEFAEPSIPAAIDAAIQAGSNHITLLPYFLACGAHVSEHIPALIAAKQSEYPTTLIQLKPYIGASPGMVDLLAAAV